MPQTKAQNFAYNLVQLNEIDELLYGDTSGSQAYPQLFSNQDSLFAPDQIYGNHHIGQQSREKYVKIQIQEQKDRRKSDNYARSSLGCHSRQQQIFQQYLETLDIKQLINMQQSNNHNSNTPQIPSKTHTKNPRNNSQSSSSLQCTFKPNILKKSNDIAGNLAPAFQRLTMAVRSQIKVKVKKSPYRPVNNNKQMQKQYSKERIQRLSRPRALKTQPQEIVQYKKTQLQKKYIIPKSSNYLDVAARNQLWEQQRQIKISKLRREQQQIKIKKQSGTFAPKLTQYRGDRLANISAFGKQGIANYFQRVNMAKSKVYSGKENSVTYRRESNSPYCSNNSKTPRKQAQKKVGHKVKYDDAVKELHKKLMSLNI